MSRYTPDESAIEREQVEWVFGLTRGELETNPLVYQAPQRWSFAPGETYTPLREHTERYWYEGAPDYMELKGERYDNTYLTVVDTGGAYGPGPSPWVVIADEAWMLVETSMNSGEMRCPGQDEDGGNKVRRDQCNLVPTYQSPRKEARCALCDERIGSEHGYIYLGDGAYEAVYVLQDESTMTREQ